MTRTESTTTTAVHPTVTFFEDMLDHVYTDHTRVLVERGAGYGLATTFAPSPDLNLLYLDAPDPGGLGVTPVLTRLQKLNVPFLCAVTPDGVEQGLPALLTDGGAGLLLEMPIMTIGLGQLHEQDAPVSGLEVRRVRTEEDWQAWGEVSIDAFDFAPELAAINGAALRQTALDDSSRARFYLGLLGGQPVGTALTVLGAREVGVWCVGTAKAARRHGVGAAMTTAPLLDARADGYVRARLGATPMGFPLYERLGWQTEHHTPFHLFQPTGSQPEA